MTHEIRTYQDVIDAGLIQPKKRKYTLRDVNEIETDSLFTPNGTFSRRLAAFIVICTAIYHYGSTDSIAALSENVHKARGGRV